MKRICSPLASVIPDNGRAAVILAILGVFFCASNAVAQIQVQNVTWGQGATPVFADNACSAGQVVPNGNLTLSAATKCNGSFSCAFDIISDTDLNLNGIKGEFPQDDPAYGCSKPFNAGVYTCASDGLTRNVAPGPDGRTLTMTCPVPPKVFASGISPVIAYDPIFPAALVNPDSAESKPTPTVGYDDPRWVNPHPASAFPKPTHPWETDGWVPAAFKFDANWINAWNNLDSDGAGGPGQSWTKYSTQITGSGSFVLQFLADNASWIYINGELVGFQDYHWSTNGSGRYTIDLHGNGPHELSFVIWDGGGLAGGKFRIETVESFEENNPGEELPPPPPAPDTTAPVITSPGDIVAEATSADGAAVTFEASAMDSKDGTVTLNASPTSGSTFAIGTTTVNLSATDAAGNDATASFTVTVQDTIAPAVTAPVDIVAEATSADGAVVTFPAAAATDAVGVTSNTAAPASGSTFPLGDTNVTVTAKDAAGNVGSADFTVTVVDTTAPVVTAPPDQTLEATSASGAAATFAASATDAVGVDSITYSHAPGSTFGLGATVVTATATDAAGNSSNVTFKVTVVDTTAPALNVPENQILEATSASGAVATFEPTATDAVGVTSLTTSHASGSTFPIGTTSVSVSASDAAGNASGGSFTIKVQDTTAPSLTGVTPSTGTLWPPNHQMVAIRLTIASGDVVGVTGYQVTVTSNEPDNGLGDGDTANDIQISGSGTLNPVINLRSERSGKGNGRTYTITVQAIDAAGNISAAKTTTVSVPKSQGKK